MALTVAMAVISTLNSTILARRNNGLSARLLNGRDEGHRVIAFVSDHLLGGKAFDQRRRLGDVADLPAGESPTQRVAQRIDGSMDLGAQSATRAPERLWALFFWAPAACWWARTVVLSISSACKSASPRIASMRRCQTPFLLQREKRVYTLCQLPNSGCTSRQGLPVRAIQSTASRNKRLSFAVTPQSVTLPGSNAAIRSHWSFRSIFLGISGLS